MKINIEEEKIRVNIKENFETYTNTIGTLILTSLLIPSAGDFITIDDEYGTFEVKRREYFFDKGTLYSVNLIVEKVG